MTRRILARDEYPRLVGTYLEPLIEALPLDADVIVVEDANGVIVGGWSAFPVTHLEGIFIAPEHQKTGRVARHLLAGMTEQLKARGIRRVVTAAITPDVEDLIRRIGGTPLQGAHFVVEI